MTDVIYEDLGKGCRYIKTGNVFEEIPSEQEYLFRGVPVSHGYMFLVTMENVLWVDGLNDKPTIEDKLMENEQ